MVIIMAKKQKERYYFHLTDTFGGELNYCWIRRYWVDAYSLHGALCIVSRELGYNFSLYCNDIYHAKGACIAICFESWETIDYMQQYDVASFSAYKNVTGA